MWEDDPDDQADDSEYDPEEERKRVESLPLYQKAEEIRDLTRSIVDSIENGEVKMIHCNVMLEDSMLLPDMIAGAEAVGDYIQKMEYATLIKIHARSLQAKSASLVFDGVLPEEYLRLLRKEIEEFRRLFREWVRSFVKYPKQGDGWGLFVDEQ